MTPRTLLISFLANYFRKIPIPENYSSVTKADALIISRESRLITQSILQSFAQRSAQPKPERYSSAECRGLRWITIAEVTHLNNAEPQFYNRRFITLNVIHGRGPLRESPSYRESIWRSLKTILSRRALIVDFGESFTPAQSAGSTRSLERLAKLDFYRMLKLYRGTPFQPRRIQARMVLGGHEFERECLKIAAEINQPVAKIKRRAKKEFYQLASNPNRLIYLGLLPLAQVIVRSLFTQVRTTGFKNFLEAAKNRPVALVSMHRSHLDYIILGDVFYQSKINTPLIAAGLNLSFWPFGFIIRSLGGYFVKRETKKDPVHAMVLQRYVTYLVKRGHSQEFFIEGGRSRSGRMMPPKLGILATLVSAFAQGVRKDIVIVPVSISYERVAEENVYGKENTGKGKERESLYSLFKALKIFKHKFGEVVIVFGQPIPISAAPENAQNPRVWSEDLLRRHTAELGDSVTHALQKQISPTLTGMACASLLMAPRYALREPELIKSLNNLCSLLDLLRKADPKLGAASPLLQRFINGEEGLLSDLGRSPIVSVELLHESRVFYIAGKRRYSADFYKNGVVHIFFNCALLALLELSQDKILESDLVKFHAIFEHEFLLGTKQEFLDDIQRTINILKESQTIRIQDGHVRFTRESPYFIPLLLLSSIQSHLWVRKNLTHPPTWLGYDEAGSGRVILVSEFFTFLQEKFRLAARIGSLTRTEASSRAELEAVLDSLIRRRLVQTSFSASGKKLIQLKELSQEEFKLLEDTNEASLSYLDAIQRRLGR